MSAKKFRVYSAELNWAGNCFFQGAFIYASSAVARMAECTHERVWVEDENENDVTEKLIAEAPKNLRVRLSRSVLEWHVTFGRGKEGSQRGRGRGVGKT